MREKDVSNLHLSLFLLLFTFGSSSRLTAEENMVIVPKGSYAPLYLEFESPKNKKDQPPKSKVKRGAKIIVPSFKMDRYPVTRREFQRFVLQNKNWRRSARKQIFADQSYLSDWESDEEIGNIQSPKSPVRFVSWFAANAYCRHEGKRLPTLAEWEYVAGAYKNIKNLKQTILDWYSKPTPKTFADVGTTMPPNDYGIYDLHGLVWEWVEDFNSSLVTGESRGDASLDRSAFCGSGGLGASNFKDYAAFMRFGFRSSLRGSFALANLGFRCARGVGDENAQ